MTQYAILTDLNKCVGCLACSVSCKVINNEIGRASCRERV